jgi:hypothetical protein
MKIIHNARSLFHSMLHRRSQLFQLYGFTEYFSLVYYSLSPPHTVYGFPFPTYSFFICLYVFVLS